ncbi:CheR family methyltransferase [Agaribacter marinus]|uniref:Chemotaxis protein methyltransferase n=1 Tax=Agaribacter marinus TaxID=1431249 RepID=A0AA37SX76_9ALTE|nr:CheR family methyltransferase [Agaribacter marinus]GLR71481.1 chemotaxis protein methyltransferase [Agaribacter marinus]
MALSAEKDKEFEFRSADFNAVRTKLKAIAGINLSENKDSMVYSRLSRRIRHLKLRSFSEYLQYVDAHIDEHEEFVNALTTNLTSFFREKHHFDYLKRFVASNKRPLKIWCAAASTGEEPYSIAMSVVEGFGKFDIPVNVVSSDIDSKVLTKASAGIYDIKQLDGLAKDVKKRFFHRGKGKNQDLARVVPELRRLVNFKKINLMDASWDLAKDFDIVFCRNVMIYFDKPTQLDILTKIVRHMKSDSLYFAGHSENFSHVSTLLTPLGKTIYRPKI